MSQLARKRLCGLKVPRSTSSWSARSLPRQERCPGAVREKAEQDGASSAAPTSPGAWRGGELEELSPPAPAAQETGRTLLWLCLGLGLELGLGLRLDSG